MSNDDKLQSRDIAEFISFCIFIIFTSFVWGSPQYHKIFFLFYLWIAYIVVLFFAFIAIRIDSIFYKKKIISYNDKLSKFEKEYDNQIKNIDIIVKEINVIYGNEYYRSFKESLENQTYSENGRALLNQVNKIVMSDPKIHEVGNNNDQLRFLSVACYKKVFPKPPYRKYNKYKYY